MILELGEEFMHFGQLRRREFLALLGSAVAPWPLGARAQQPAMPVIGFLSSGSPGPSAQSVAAFRQGLSGFGYVEGRNLAIEFRFAQGQYARLPAQAAELAGRQVAVIVAAGPPAALAAKAATATIPIVFSIGDDPVKLGLVPSLNRPGGNATGVYTLTSALEAKRLELLHELVPNAVPVAMLVNPHSPDAETQLKDVPTAARVLRLELHVLKASNVSDIDAAFATLVEQRIGALLVASDAFFNSQREHLIALAARHAIPAIYFWPEFAAAGGLMSYGSSLTEAYRLAGTYAGRILKGEKPADLPVQQSTKVELIINLKTAKVLGLTVPLSLLGRVDQVIE